MCGFAGQYLFETDAAVSPELLNRQTVRLRHRGPEDTGIWHSGNVGLAHTRLKLLDLNNAAQPMLSPRGSVIAYNGEIFNNTELRAELTAYGYQFLTRSDTEVVLAAYDTWGSAAWKRLNGMFAFALFDRHSQTLFLVRDRLGIKPLFYSVTSDGIQFGSEPSGWDSINVGATELNPEMLLHFLRFSQPVWNDRCIHAGLMSVEPGACVEAATGSIVVKQWWSPESELVETSETAELAAKANIRHLLHLSVGRQLMADVPVGILLSGGLDSSILIALYHQMVPSPPHTFAIALEGDTSELQAAKLVADHFRSLHHEFIVTPEDFFAGMRELIRIRQLPAALPNEVLIYLLAKQARQHVKAVFSGEGADELFGGYTQILSKLHAYHRAETAATNGNALFMHALRSENPDWNLESESRFFAAAYSWFMPQELNALLRPHWQEKLSEFESNDRFASVFRKFSHLSPINCFHGVLEFAHLPGLLARLDGATMAASLEGRVPFTDTQLVSYVASLPPELKYDPARQGKWLLRSVFADLLPEQVINLPKRAFHVPLRCLFASDPANELRREIMQNALLVEFFDRDNLQRLTNPNVSVSELMNFWLIASLHMFLIRNM